MTNNTIKAGIKTIKTNRGLEVWSTVKNLHIGTVKGKVYEKVSGMLYHPEPSFTLSLEEYQAIVDGGAEFFRLPFPRTRQTCSFQTSTDQTGGAGYEMGYKKGISLFMNIVRVRECIVLKQKGKKFRFLSE